MGRVVGFKAKRGSKHETVVAKRYTFSVVTTRKVKHTQKQTRP